MNAKEIRINPKHLLDLLRQTGHKLPVDAAMQRVYVDHGNEDIALVVTSKQYPAVYPHSYLEREFYSPKSPARPPVPAIMPPTVNQKLFDREAQQ